MIKKTRKIRKTRKAQEEMIGFVLIILLLLVIGLVFFVFSIKKPIKRESGKAASFLDSSLLYTTDCILSGPEPLSVSEVIRSCYDEEKCVDGRDTCYVLEEIYKKLLENIETGEGRFLAGYRLNINYSVGAEGLSKEIINIEEGECKNKDYESASRYKSLDGDIITTKLDICYETV